jgi:phosphoglycolate phosphatase-like HAD superfamily hydrolase
MRHGGVEIKVTYEGDQLARARDVLHLDDDEDLTIWFYDDITPGVRLPLVDAGVVIRARDRGDDSDATVKLRPCRASQLVAPWPDTKATDALDFTIEEDWAGERRVLAASARASLAPADLTRVRARKPPPAGLLSRRQIDYLTDCAPIRLNLDETAALGPIEATRWRAVHNDGLRKLDVRAERWRVPGMEFLELSIKVDRRDDAEAAQQALELALTALGLPPNRRQETKTRRVLERLSGSRANGDSLTAAGADLAGAAVLFDIGDTLAEVTVSPGGGSITQLAVHPQVPAVLRGLRDRGARIGIISNRGSVPAQEVDRALRDAGLMDFVDPQLIVYGPKNTTLAFEQAAALAGDPARRVYVGEDAAERTQAARAGYLVAPHPELALAVLAPPSP